MQPARIDRLIRQLSLFGALVFERGPRWGTIFVTRKCNLRCSYCVVPLKGRNPDISTDQWYAVIDRLAAWGVKLLTVVGGEPTVRQDLEDIIAFAQSRGMYVFLHSNFTLLDKPKIRGLSELGLFAITGSLDSMSSFEKSNCGVLDLLAYAGECGIVPIVSSVLTRTNANELSAIAEKAISRGILFNFGLYQHVGGLFSARDPRLIPAPEIVLSVASQLRRLKDQTGGIRSSYNFLRTENLAHYHGGWKCNPLKDHWIVVNNDGTLMRCQEYGSDLKVVDLEFLDDPVWREHKVDTVGRCSGCYHHCYFDAETLREAHFLREWKGILKGLQFGARRSKGGAG